MNDPVRELRRKVDRWSGRGRSTGYLLWLAAMVVFFIGFARGFDGPAVPIIVFCLIGGSVLLVPTIILGYAVKAAERDDRAHGR